MAKRSKAAASGAVHNPEQLPVYRVIWADAITLDQPAPDEAAARAAAWQHRALDPVRVELVKPPKPDAEPGESEDQEPVPEGD